MQHTPTQNVTVIGTQWGDEGKGKVIDWLASRADLVVRFQGGNNAGHTIAVGNATYKFALLPSGVVQGKASIIGNGVVVDPWSLLDEIDRARAQGLAVTPDILTIADTATLVLPLHRELDIAREARAGARRIGTTGRGIGPAYEDKAGRRAIRFADLGDPQALCDRVDRLLAHHAPLRADLGLPPVAGAEILALLAGMAPRIGPYLRPVAWRQINQAMAAGRRVLFEGAQAAMLDIDHGTYPYTTSSNTVAGQVFAGSGAAPGSTGRILGIVKAYTTRVGRGRFPPNARMPSASDSAAAAPAAWAPSSAPTPAASAAAAGSTRCWSASPSNSTASPASCSPSWTCWTASTG